MLVKEMKIGNTKIEIYDDYCCDKTPEDVRKILDRIATRVIANLQEREALSQSIR